MRIWFVGLALLFVYKGVLCDELCKERASLASSMVPTKVGVIESLQEEPQSGPMGEVWRYLAFMYDDAYKKLGYDSLTTEAISKLVANNSFSTDWRIDLLIFNDYFLAACEENINISKIASINVNHIRECFGSGTIQNPKSRECMKEIIAQ